MAALANGKEGGGKRGPGPPQTLKRLSLCGFAKMSRSLILLAGVAGKGLPGPLYLPLGKTASDAGEADSWPCSPGIYGQQCKRGSLLPACSELLRALPHPLPNTVNQKTGSFPVPAVLLFPRPLIPWPPSNPPPPLQTYPPHPNFLPLQTSHVNRSHSWCLVLFQRVQVGLWPGGGTFEINFMSD